MRNAAGLDRVGGGVEGGGNLVVADIVVTARSPGVQSTGYQRLKTTSRRRLYRYALCHVLSLLSVLSALITISRVIGHTHYSSHNGRSCDSNILYWLLTEYLEAGIYH
ncbi:hypothetical protein LSTR_LSTR016931 [Laodelphax striatellus]|uniref:Uncharacterized protein n=1 Tax=Laodelphax striatellus TaxID=195883 RepID=A0A482WZD6_LAOST|nr:hypothetical protein LSTR_LSTR016931 [Laodelphax striatellus]